MSVDGERPTDVTDLVSAGEPILSLVLNRTSDGVVVATGDGVIVLANQPLLSLFGYERHELIGKRVEALIPDDYRRRHRTHVQQFGRSPHPRPMGRPDLDIEGQHKDGTRVPVDVQLNPVAHTGLVVATVRDMTEQRRQTADHALIALDLARTKADNDRLAEVLDLIVQRLFALGMTLSAGTARAEDTMAAIDAIIAEVHDVRRVVGVRPSAPARS